MTSINAVRFDDNSGVMLCDEQRGWNEENLKVYAVEKGKPIISPRIQKEQGLVAAYANTGTSTIGDELRFSIRKRISDLYAEKIEVLGKKPSPFLSMEDAACIAYDTICGLKHKHINDELLEKFGFDTPDFIRGYYSKNGEKIEIRDKSIIDEVMERITWKKRGAESKAVFLNAGIVAGYSPVDGFNIYHVSMIEAHCEPVDTAFAADGSGCDTANITFSDYFNDKSCRERRKKLDPVDGVMVGISALNTASSVNLGVGGYYNIILFDGNEKDNSKKMRLVDSHEAKLAAEIVLGRDHGFLSARDARRLVEEVIFNGMSFEKAGRMMLAKAKNKSGFNRLLRGYKIG